MALSTVREFKTPSAVGGNEAVTFGVLGDLGQTNDSRYKVVVVVAVVVAAAAVVVVVVAVLVVAVVVEAAVIVAGSSSSSGSSSSPPHKKPENWPRLDFLFGKRCIPH